MSKDKSKLKGLFRIAPLVAAADFVPLDDRSRAAVYRRADSVRTAFEDGAIRFSSISQATGREVYKAFERGINSTFAAFPRAHTHILCFDAKAHVPHRKAAMQESRRAAMAAAVARRGGPKWTWDGTSPIVANTFAPLPAWEGVRLDSRAYKHATNDIIALLLDHYTPAPGTRLVIDSEAGAMVLECTPGGIVLAPRAILHGKPAIGEADMSALYYALWARTEAVDDDDDIDVVHASRATAPRDVDLACYYGLESTSVPLEMRAAASGAVSTYVPRAAVRARYEPGDVVLVSTDSDFLPLGLVATLYGEQAQVAAHRVHVSIGRVHLAAAAEPLRVVTRSTAGARPHAEYYDMARVARIVRHMHGVAADPVSAIWCFVAFCAACGNDYTQRMQGVPGFSHQAMFAAYRTLLDSGRQLVRILLLPPHLPPPPRPIPRVSPIVFARLVLECFHTRLPDQHRPVPWELGDDARPSWPELAAVVRNVMPNAAMLSSTQLLQYYEQVAWSVAYAATALDGKEHVPLQVNVAE